MKNGISIYLGLDNTPEENIQLIKTAHKHDIRRIFTSLHIPETDTALLQKELHEVLRTAGQYNMEIISDVSPNTLMLLNMDKLDTDRLRQIGISTIRPDFGYSEKNIAALSRRIKIQLNASTLTEDFLDNLKFYHTDFSFIEALHNFYPREGTGLNEKFLLRQNRMLHSHEIQTAAFAPSYNRARSPLKRGLPTLEMHRYKPLGTAIGHLSLLETDSVFIGDSLPTEAEIDELSHLTKHYAVLKAKCLTQNQFVKKLLAENIFTVRQDAADAAIRTQESRLLCKNEKIYPEYTAERRPGMITMDNINNGRYMGEIQIIMREQKADENINVIGRIVDSDMILLKFIKPNGRFKIKFV